MSVEAVKQALAGYGYRLLCRDELMVEEILKISRQHVLTYCNIEKVPEALEHVVVMLTVGEFLYRKKVSGQLSEGQAEGAFEFSPEVTRYTVGEETTEWAGPSKYSAASPEAAFDDMVATLRSLPTYELELQEFRRLPWNRRKRYRRY